MKQPLKWSYGLTTVPSRIDTTLPRTLKSLEAAGFAKPRLFVDGTRDPRPYLHLFGPIEVTTRYPNLRTFGNWITALWELYIRDPHADRYAIFQDDFVTYRNLRGYLDLSPFPKNGYLNLYTFPENLKLAKGRKGWYPSNQRGRGAVALVFGRNGVVQLLQSPHMAVRPQCKKRGWRAVDGAVVSAMRKSKFQEYVHNPSLVQHIGIESSMGSQRHPLADSFLGEEYDALELIKPPENSNTVPRDRNPAESGAPAQAAEKRVVLPSPEVDDNQTRLQYESWTAVPTGVLPSPSLTPENEMPAKFRIGLIGYNTRSGLGELNRQFAEYLPIERWLVVPQRGRKTIPVASGVGHVITRGEPRKTQQFIDTIDVLLFAETPFYQSAIAYAKSKGKRIVCVPMIEWLPHPDKSDWVKNVDLFICPTRQCYNAVVAEGLPATYFPWPVDTVRFQFRHRMQCERLLFINGHGGYKGRKGADVMIRAAELFPSQHLTVVDQSNSKWPERVHVVRELDSNDLIYELGDVLISPHKVDGLGLEPMEAMACGLPVVSTDGEPWTEIPAIERIPAVKGRKYINRQMDWYEPDYKSLAEICDRLIGANIDNESCDARRWAMNRSWVKHQELMESVILGTAGQDLTPDYWCYDADSAEEAGADDRPLPEEDQTESPV